MPSSVGYDHYACPIPPFTKNRKQSMGIDESSRPKTNAIISSAPLPGVLPHHRADGLVTLENVPDSSAPANELPLLTAHLSLSSAQSSFQKRMLCSRSGSAPLGT